MGCAVACVASRLGVSYDRALDLFSDRAAAWSRGYLCREVVDALGKVGLKYQFEKCEKNMDGYFSVSEGSIVFVGPCLAYPLGHYLLRTGSGWMNPWSNFPRMVPVTAAIEPWLPGAAEYVLRPIE